MSGLFLEEALRRGEVHHHHPIEVVSPLEGLHVSLQVGDLLAIGGSAHHVLALKLLYVDRGEDGWPRPDVLQLAAHLGKEVLRQCFVVQGPLVRISELQIPTPEHETIERRELVEHLRDRLGNSGVRPVCEHAHTRDEPTLHQFDAGHYGRCDGSIDSDDCNSDAIHGEPFACVRSSFLRSST